MRAQAVMRKIELLLIEDNPSDVLFTEEALRLLDASVCVHVARDGEEALWFLHRIGEYAHAPRPDLVLLDLNLPKISGVEVLAEIKRDPRLRSIPVVIVSTSSSEDDIRRTYDLHANSYITKPLGIGAYSDALRSLEGFWLGTAELPSP